MRYFRDRFFVILSATVIAWMGPFTTHSAYALQISVQPSVTNTIVGQNIQIEVVALDLMTGAAPSIGAYHIELSFDSTLLSLSSVSFGAGLDLGVLGSLQNVISTAGAIEIDETSFELESSLNTLQPGSFTLFTLGFTAGMVGSSNLGLTLFSISDGSGLISIIPTAINNGIVNISSGASGPLPEPDAMILLTTGLVGMGMAIRRGSRKNYK